MDCRLQDDQSDVSGLADTNAGSMDASLLPPEVVSELLATVRVRLVRCGCRELTGPWKVEAPTHGGAWFYVLARGACWLEVDGEQPRPLASGDVVAVLDGRAHSLRDSGRAACGDLGSLLVFGSFHFDDHESPVLRTLPPTIVVAGADERARQRLNPTVQLMAVEAESNRSGARAVIGRLAEVLFIEIVRSSLASRSGEQSSWLPLMAQRIGMALSLVHENPERAWTVAGLALAVGLSRSTFAGRFVDLVGEPPLYYVTRCRMRRAAALLRGSAATLTDVACRVGYESEAAFGKAFKRWLGMTPGAYRKAAKRTQGLQVA